MVAGSLQRLVQTFGLRLASSAPEAAFSGWSSQSSRARRLPHQQLCQNSRLLNHDAESALPAWTCATPVRGPPSAAAQRTSGGPEHRRSSRERQQPPQNETSNSNTRQRKLDIRATLRPRRPVRGAHGLHLIERQYPAALPADTGFHAGRSPEEKSLRSKPRATPMHQPESAQAGFDCLC